MVKEIWQQRALAERGMILLALRQSVGPHLDSATLRGVLDRLGLPTEKEHFDRHMVYLAEKGYVRKQEFRTMGMRMRCWSITADGRDVLLGVIEEPGVLVPDFESE